MDDVSADLKHGLQTDRPHSARVWNYLLGGKDNYQVDSEVGETILSTFPEFAAVARLQRGFLVRAVRFLAAEAGIRQFLDIGTGLPTADNTHEVAQRIAPDSRIVYVDNDPLVLAHARALLASSPQGACAYLSEDVRNPERILAEAAQTLDLSRPVALTLLGIMGQLSDADRPAELVATLLRALPSGSYIALSDGINTNEALNAAVTAYNAQSANTYHLCSPEEIAGYFTGLDVVDPGIVATSAWRPDGTQTIQDAVDVAMCGVARKN
ncbi:SAM-dependent methyltransferase [Streptomyces longispororuber]|uniref:SAM-dependent methyltransferase n=1 Tax=Streptomyces longispororuber TaxID=68230 RepID=UPI00210A4CEA|nr:SAM-dependent methyltransferase [Streptomyces longispororuber]MCQ4211343.1 SAM-dependent methyltransferase [Streptomyces longispororuber]